MNIYVERLKEMKDDSAQTDSLYGKKAIVCETQTEDELIVDRPKWVLSSEQDYETQTSDEALANAARSNWSTPSLEKSVAPETQTRPRRSFFRGILVGVGVVSLTIGVSYPLIPYFLTLTCGLSAHSFPLYVACFYCFALHCQAIIVSGKKSRR
jgi:hypothetical protein